MPAHDIPHTYWHTPYNTIACVRRQALERENQARAVNAIAEQEANTKKLASEVLP